MFEFEAANAKDYEQDVAELFRDNHAAFVLRGFLKMPRGMTGLDSGQPWFLYWLSEALEVFDVQGCSFDDDMKHAAVQYLAKC